MFRVVIPARHGSSRLPGKPLLPLAGKPLLQWVHERARRSAAAEILVATDDERIADTARGFGARVVMTALTASNWAAPSWSSDVPLFITGLCCVVVTCTPHAVRQRPRRSSVRWLQRGRRTRELACAGRLRGWCYAT